MDVDVTVNSLLIKPGVGLRSFLALAQAARPRQWIKNLACFAGLVFSGRMMEPAAIVESIVAFAGFCLAASAVYLFNDVVDRRLDRLNPSKRNRPIASGVVPVSWALGAAALLAAGALGTTIWLAPLCLMVMSLYLVMNVAYSLRLKHTVLLDVVIIAFGFVLRVLHGVYAIEVKPTSWIVLCMFFLALFLGFAKRRGEMHLMGDDEPFRRPVLSKYRISFLDLMLGMTATLAVLCYALYTVTGHRGNASLVVTVPLVMYGVSRYLLLVTVDGEGEAPDKLLVTDRILLGTGSLWVASCVLVIYSKIQLFTE